MYLPSLPHAGPLHFLDDFGLSSISQLPCGVGLPVTAQTQEKVRALNPSEPHSAIHWNLQHNTS